MPFRIATSHYHVGHIIPAMVAKEMTYFEEEGLDDYEVVTGGLVPAIVERVALRRAMKEKGIDIVADPKPSSVFTLRGQGEDIYIVGCWRNQHDFQFLGARGLKGLKDLKGKRIGVRDYWAIDHAVMRVYLGRQGIDPEKDVTWLRGAHFHLAREVAADSLRKGMADCVPVPPSTVPGLLAEGYPLLLDTRQLYPNGMPVRVIATTRRVLEEKSEALEAYLRATIRAYWFIMDEEKNRGYINALNRRLRRQSPDEEEQKLGYLEGSSSATVLPLDGAPSIEGLQSMLAEAKEMGDVRPDFSLEDVLKLDPVRRAYETLRRKEDLASALKRAQELFHNSRRPLLSTASQEKSAER
ncbi:MAG: ABC transporter substrate-binding protein [Deltaproteobacteria bacterium]|nr:ABC transporter substrate-binding protein [Deltaproteobacteria bacterium]